MKKKLINGYHEVAIKKGRETDKEVKTKRQRLCEIESKREKDTGRETVTNRKRQKRGKRWKEEIQRLRNK